MPHHKLRAMRIQTRIEQPFNLRQIDPAILCVRMIPMRQHRKKCQRRYQQGRKTALPPVIFLPEPL